MSKTTHAHEDSNDRVAILERELQLTREQHAAELAAIRDDIRAAKERDTSSAAKELAEVLAKALEPQTARIEAVDPQTQRERDQKKTDEMCNRHAKAQVEGFRDLLTGERGYYVSVMEPRRGAEGKVNQSVATPMPGMVRLVFSDSEAAAIAKWEAHMGVADPGLAGLSKYMSVWPKAILATEEECEPVRKRCLEHIERVSDSASIVRLMLAAGEKAFADRMPKEELDTLEKMLSD